MADDQNGAALRPPVGDDLPEALVGIEVEPGVRFVEQENLRICQQCQAKFNFARVPPESWSARVEAKRANPSES